MITIIDYGMGNLRSVQKAFERLEIQALVTSNPTEITRAEKLILPGVGFFGTGMKNLRERGFIDLLGDAVLVRKIPVLGICLGMQLLTSFSEEGNCGGLGWIDAETLMFKIAEGQDKYKVPHMGWNTLEVIDKNEPLFGSLNSDSTYYFAHSYYVSCNNRRDVIATTNYGANFDSVIRKENIYGVQFHPEKSLSVGLQLLRNFAERI